MILSPWAEKSPGTLTPMLDYRLQVEKRGLFNTPNTFGIYALERVLAWVEDLGGLDAMAARNQAKADALYGEIDRTGFYSGHAQVANRSNMNVTFRTPSDALDAKFVEEADAAGLKGLKGHRSVGGLRASIYNACPPESVDALVAFMAEFERERWSAVLAHSISPAVRMPAVEGRLDALGDVGTEGGLVAAIEDVGLHLQLDSEALGAVRNGALSHAHRDGEIDEDVATRGGGLVDDLLRALDVFIAAHPEGKGAHLVELPGVRRRDAVVQEAVVGDGDEVVVQGRREPPAGRFPPPRRRCRRS